MIRIFLDTETTGLSTVNGDEQGPHRVVEIGCVKTVNGSITDRFHTYLDPGREVPEESFRIHGLNRSFLSQYHTFSKVYDRFLDFIRGHVLVIHNARFDISFLNWELAQIKQAALENPVEDTLILARKKFPGAPASLDALCRRFRVSLVKRALHGALLDAELLCAVYYEMCREQTSLNFHKTAAAREEALPVLPGSGSASKGLRPAREFPISPQEEEGHRLAWEDLKKK